MTYTKNHDPWASGDLITTTVMDNLESIYTEASGYISTHTHDALYPTKAEMEAIYWYSGNDGSGSGSDADLIYWSGGNLHAADFAGMGVPSGLIVMWSGGAVPAGWALCDGTGGTVDLTDRFVYGAGTVAVGTNGSGQHTPAGTVTIAGRALTADEVAGHQHSYYDYYRELSPTYIDGGPTAPYPGDNYSTAKTTGNSNIGKATADAHSHSAGEGTAFTGAEFTALPPYYALAFIQKT